MLDLALSMRSVNGSVITNKLVPGTPQYIDGISYWIPDKAAAKDVVQQLFR